MYFKYVFSRYVGLVASGIICVAILWLAHNDKLGFYIHPRYNVLTIASAVVGLCVIVLAILVGERGLNAKLTARIATWEVLMLLFVIFSMLIAKPAHLSNITVAARGVNDKTDSVDIGRAESSSLFSNTDYSHLAIKDWSGLLSKQQDASFFAGKTANISGFIARGDTPSKDNIYVSRFIISCCVVDARPIGVPVYVPDWEQRFKPDQWVSVSGVFVVRHNKAMIQPVRIESIQTPKDMYVF